jgi:uncharacterized protein YbgA (DUF1722 family)/uncharacterized protein YbbK (DUF523 family)
MMNNHNSKILLGISECLLGCKVRFDAGHKHNRYITDTLGHFFKFQSYCPEVGIGMGIPREPIRLVGDPANPKVLGTKDPSIDVTDALNNYCEDIAKKLPSDLYGFILKSKSPTCGMERVKVYHSNGNPNASASGIFAKALATFNPQLPLEEEGRLADPVLRENFVTRVLLFRDWQDLKSNGLSAKSLLEFHTNNKLSLMAHYPASYQDLGRLIANLKGKDLNEIATEYFAKLMRAFSYKVTRAKNTNVLQHCAGYLKKDLLSDDKQELSTLIMRYRAGEIPLIVPITLLQHYFRKFPNDYMLRQRYLNPYPNELSLRNEL